MKRRTWNLSREKGFTLVELLVVMSILAILAAVVVPAVTGVNTTARNTAQSQDINELQDSVTHFNADAASWPTKASLAGANPGWDAGSLPGAAYTSSGSTYTFTVDSIAGIAFTSTNGAKTFVPDYASSPKHISDTVSVANNSSQSFTTNRQGITATVVLSNSTGNPVSFDAWGIDSKGGVWNFVDKDSY